MVGVAGKSKACNECRRRRIKHAIPRTLLEFTNVSDQIKRVLSDWWCSEFLAACHKLRRLHCSFPASELNSPTWQCDFQRPFCSRCIRAKKPCSGYDRDIIFVNRTPTNPSLTAQTVLSGLRKKELQNHDVRILMTEVDRLLSPTCPPLELRSFAVHLLKRLYLPQEYESENGQTVYAWLHAIPGLKNTSQSLDTALKSFCMALLYITGSDISSLEKSLNLYNRALQQLRADIENPEANLNEETLAAIVVVSTTELFVSLSDDGWQAHARGISEILRMRGPVESEESIWRRLCSRLRTICTLDALTKRQTPFLTAEEWRKYLSIRDGTELGDYDAFIDIISNAPLLFEETEEFLECRNSAVITKWGSSLLKSYGSVVQKMHFWQDRLTNGSEEPLYSITTSKLSHPADTEMQSLFSSILEFKSLNVAILLTFSWAVLVQVYSSMIRIQTLMENNVDISDEGPCDLVTSSSNLGDISATVPKDGAFMIQEADRLAHLICRSLEYCYRYEMGMLGPQATTYPQWSIRNFYRQFPGHDKELRWCYEFRNMRGPGSHCGVVMMKFRDSTESAGQKSKLGRDEET